MLNCNFVRSRLTVLSSIAAGALLLSACGGGSSSLSSAAASAAASKPAAASAAASAKPAASAAASASAKPAASAPAAAASGKPAASAGASPGAAPQGVTVTMVSPKDGSSVPAGDITVNYDVVGTTLVPGADAKKLDDYHVHVLIDTDAAPYLAPQFLPIPTGNDKIIHTAAKTVTFKAVAAGAHTLNVILTTSNHVAVSPPIQTSAKFTPT